MRVSLANGGRGNGWGRLLHNGENHVAGAAKAMAHVATKVVESVGPFFTLST